MSNNRNLGNIATAITNATSGQVLTSQGNGVATFSDVAGGGSFSAINVASRIITSDTTVSATESALSVGPIEIANGVTLTVASGGRHLVL